MVGCLFRKLNWKFGIRLASSTTTMILARKSFSNIVATTDNKEIGLYDFRSSVSFSVLWIIMIFAYFHWMYRSMTITFFGSSVSIATVMASGPSAYFRFRRSRSTSTSRGEKGLIGTAVFEFRNSGMTSEIISRGWNVLLRCRSKRSALFLGHHIWPNHRHNSTTEGRL